MNYKTLAALIMTMTFWGSSFVATKVILDVWPPWAYMFLRFFLASLVFLGILGWKKQLRLPPKVFPKVFLISLFEPGRYFIFETLGLSLTSAASASLIIAAVPAVVALVSAVFLKEHLRLIGWVGTLLSITGIALITFFDRGSGGSDSLAGNIFILLAVFSATGYIVLTRSMRNQVSALQLTAYQTFLASIFFLPGIFFQGGELVTAGVTLSLGFSLGFVVLGATVAAFLGYNYALSKVPAPQASVFINGIPVVTIIVGWLVLGEGLNLVQIIGGSLAIIGLTLANQRQRKKESSA